MRASLSAFRVLLTRRSGLAPCRHRVRSPLVPPAFRNIWPAAAFGNEHPSARLSVDLEPHRRTLCSTTDTLVRKRKESGFGNDRRERQPVARRGHAGPGRRRGVQRGGWVGLIKDRPELARLALDEALGSEAMLMGRRTYEWFAARWPSRTWRAGGPAERPAQVRRVVDPRPTGLDQLDGPQGRPRRRGLRL